MISPHLPSKQATRTFVAVLGVLIVAEAVAMLLLSAVFSHDGQADWREILLDVAVLSALAGPFIWWLAIRPLEAAMHGGQRFAQTLFDNAGALVVVLDREGRIIRFNPGCESATGYTAAEVVGRDLFGLLIPADVRAQVREVFSRCVEGGAFPRHFQNEWLNRHGGRRWIAWTNEVLRDAAGDVEYVVASGLDMTEAALLQRIDKLLAGLDQQVLDGRNLDDVLAFACRNLSEALGYEAVWVGRKVGDGSVDLLFATGSAGAYVDEIRQLGVRWDDTPTGHGVTGATIRGGKMQLFNAHDNDLAPWAESATRFGLRSALGLPLVIHDQVFGALVLYSSDAAAFSDANTLERLRHIGARLNVVVAAADKQQQMQLLRLAVETAGSGILVTHRDGTIEWTNRALRQMYGFDEAELVGATPRLFKSGLQGSDYYRNFWETLKRGETWRGETTNKRKDGSLLTIMQVVAPVRGIAGEVSHYISVMEDITERKAAEERTRHQAEHDVLTDLPNRALMQARLEAMLSGEKRRTNEQVGLLFLDIDHFKQINDRYGHDVGDALLCRFARQLREVVRVEDTVARVGGDEFVVLLPGLLDPADAETVARKILASLESPLDCMGTLLQVGSSIGIAHAPAHADEPSDLLKCADIAMYAAKEAGRNTYRVFDAAMAAVEA